MNLEYKIIKILEEKLENDDSLNWMDKSSKELWIECRLDDLAKQLSQLAILMKYPTKKDEE